MATWIVLIGWAARLILLLLVSLSVWSVTIMIQRSRAFKLRDDVAGLDEARKVLLAKSLKELKGWKPSTQGIRTETLQTAAASTFTSREAIDLRVRSQLMHEKLELEKGLNILATLGSNAPFIGLFGTVLGIIQAFGALASEKSSGSSQVMASLAEALVATAVGLFVAIPAVIAYNYFSQRLRIMLAESESLKDLYLSKCLGERD